MPLISCNSELLVGSVTRLGSDIDKVCPQMEDCRDEDKIEQLFCFVYAEVTDKIFKRLKVLESETRVISLFSDPNSDTRLLLHTKEQDHHLEGGIVSTQTETHSYISRDNLLTQQPSADSVISECSATSKQ